MEITTPLHGETSETPLQGIQRTCTRNSPCLLQGCLICRTPTNHVRNLDEALDDADTTLSSNDQPQPPPDHLILRLTKVLHNAIQKNNIHQMTAFAKQYTHNMENNPDFCHYDLSNLEDLYQTATNIINSHTAMSTPLPSSPPTQRAQPPQASFKPPKLIIENWDGQSYNFYSWLTSVLKGFELAQCDNPGKLHHTLHAIPLNKRGPLNHITNWDEFKLALIEEFGSINVFGRDVNQIFDSLPRYESVQEVAEDLAPKIKTLQSNLNVMTEFHKQENLYSVAITQSLIQNILRSLPLEVRPTFNEQFTQFQEQDPDNVRPPATFSFLARYVNKLKKSYQSNPNLYDLELKSLSIGIKPVRPAPTNTKPKPRSSAPPPSKPCTLCTVKGFQANHYPLNVHCGVGKLSSPDIIKIISDNHLCPSCTHQHEPYFRCKLTYYNGYSKICSKGCLHDGLPVHRRACMHSNQTPSVTVSKASINKSVPMVENIFVGNSQMGIQYDTGCQLSLISQSALSTIPSSMYTLGTSSKVRLMTYAGKGKNIIITAVKLKIRNKTLKLSTIEDDLNHGSGFSFPVPHKWRSLTKTTTSQHTGRISILLGGDNHLFFPTEIERNTRGMALYQSNLTQNYMVYGSIPSNTITWEDSLISSSTNTLFINKLNVQDIQNPPIEPTTPTKLGSPTNPDPSIEPVPTTNPGSLIELNTTTKLGSPTNPGPTIESGPPTNADPPTNPGPPTEPNPHAIPDNADPQTNLGSPTNPDCPTNANPPANLGSSTNPDPSTAPNPPIYPDPPTSPESLTNSDPPIDSDPPTNTGYPTSGTCPRRFYRNRETESSGADSRTRSRSSRRKCNSGSKSSTRRNSR